MKVGIIVVNYNKKDLLRNCLKSLEKITYDNHKVFIIDNGSSDGSKDLVAKEFSQMAYVEVGYNSGFCRANNIGIKKAFEDNCEGIILLNNDTEVKEDFIEKILFRVDKGEMVSMVASKIIFMDRRDVLDSAGLEITPDGLAKNRGLEENQDRFNESAEVFCPAGAGAFYTKELLEDVKQDGQYLDEKFGYYFEELDLGWRARLRGWRCAYAPESIIYHKKSATSGAYSEFIAFYSNRNIFYNIIKNYPGRFFWWALTLSFLRYFLLGAGIFFRKGPAKKIHSSIGIFTMTTAVLRGWRDVLLNLKRLIHDRRRIQSLNKMTQEKVGGMFDEFGLGFFSSLYK